MSHEFKSMIEFARKTWNDEHKEDLQVLKEGQDALHKERAEFEEGKARYALEILREFFKGGKKGD